MNFFEIRQLILPEIQWMLFMELPTFMQVKPTTSTEFTQKISELFFRADVPTYEGTMHWTVHSAGIHLISYCIMSNQVPNFPFTWFDLIIP